ncbi:DUF4209 domain-containing protein [Bacillus halotolerans]|uniref:DUF4209 domain-containing protein n=1 Tax=Bacillus halotolerans TaxID=260554 RepID=UPI001C3CEBF4|nr:DUF4209 domain-containing protein [Bacillus halotolerans]MBV5123664.1 DUF4209 domain-containing protein [Bacillus halotolerans]
MTNSLENILKELDEKCECLNEREIALKIRENSNCKPDDFKFISETTAFSLIAQKKDKKSNWDIYYGPLYITNDENGNPKEYPNLRDINLKMVNYWLARVEVTKNPIMRSRYADLVWEFCNLVGESKNYKMAQEVIDNNIIIIREKLYSDDFSAKSRLERGLNLALILNSKKRLNIIKELIFELEDSIPDDQGSWGFSFDLLLDNKYIDLTDRERSKVINDLEERILRLRTSKDPVPWAVEAAAIRLARHYKKSENFQGISRVLNELKKECEKFGDIAAPMQMHSWLEKLHALFIEYGLKEEVEEINKEIYKKGLEVHKNLQQVTHSIELPEVELDSFIKKFLTDDIDNDLRNLSAYFVPKKERVIDQIHKNSISFPLSFLISKSIIDHNGRKVAEIGSIEEDLNGHIIQQISQNLRIQSFFLNKVIKRLIDHHSLDSEKLLEIIMRSPVFLEERRELLKKSIEMYFHEDYISFCHIVIPQIEFAFRTLLSLCGRSILKPSRKYNGFQFKVLGDLLSDPIIESVYDTDYKLYFQILLNDSIGLNIRNDICHGISNTNVFNQSNANLLLHVLITLSLLIKQENATDKKP